MPNKILVITEKPSSAKRIADALNDNGKADKLRFNGVTYYIAQKNDSELVVVSALGHLYTVKQNGDKRGYPIYETLWAPIYQVDSSKSYTKRYIYAIKLLSEGASEYISACDYDIEGSLIAFNVIKYAIGENCLTKSKRMLFNTLTDEELNSAWFNLNNSLDYPVIAAGKARHEIDWLYGINLSRALTESARVVGNQKTLSIGRVQGPTLIFIKKREEEIKSFVPIPYWKVTAKTEIAGKFYSLYYEKPHLERDRQAKALRKACQGKDGCVRKIDLSKEVQPPPSPFNLSDLQHEAYRIFKIKPSDTLAAAEKLYLSAYISYPRTSSQRLPSTINIRDILMNLNKVETYSEIEKRILSKETLHPQQGKGDDSAHTAIYPTGKVLRKTGSQNRKIYDLIVRRFLACLSDPSQKTRKRIEVDFNGYIFNIIENRLSDPGWREVYPFSQENLQILPQEIQVGSKLALSKLAVRILFTKPPRRLNSINLLRLMESHKIGTKSTRTSIMETLVNRNYLNKDLKISDLGISVSDALEDYCPEILSVAFTRDLEIKLDKLRTGEKTYDSVINEAVEKLDPILRKIKEKEKVIGSKIFGEDNSRKKLNLIINDEESDKCCICMSENTEDSIYCENHHRSYMNLDKIYNTWRYALDLSWEGYLRKLVKLPGTGLWVKEVVQDILERL